jgi:uncharacterized damage-inducible protein DinB
VQATDVLQDAIGRIRTLVRSAAKDLGATALAHRPAPEANSIAWLLWHLTRVQDSHLAQIIGGDQLWVSGPWATDLDRAADPSDTGYGHTSDEVATVRPRRPETLVAYHEAVAERTLTWLASASEADLERIIDRSYDPPVSVGVRVTSVVSDNLQHVGQAHYLRGILQKSG